MKINLNTLQHAIQQLPSPRYSGELYNLRVNRRVDVLNRDYHHGGKMPNTPLKFDVVVLEAVMYQENSHSWLEWEINV